MTVNIRGIRQNDIEDIKQIVFNTWFTKEFKNNQALANAYAQIDLDSQLNVSSFGRVAELDGGIAGVIMGSIKDQPKQLRVFQSNNISDWLTVLAASKGDQEVISNNLVFESEVERKLLTKYSATNYEGAIELFTISPEFKNQGIGTLLFDEMMQYFSNHLISKYYLFTDSESDYSYYEHKGLRQIDSASREDGFVMYLYDYDFHSERK